MAADTLHLLAARLGDAVDDDRDEEPGKVLHELRQDELARADLTPFARYYGTVDATPLFLCLLSEHADWTGSLELFHPTNRECRSSRPSRWSRPRATSWRPSAEWRACSSSTATAIAPNG